MPEAIRTPDHCILCEEVQAAEAAALERIAQAIENDYHPTENMQQKCIAMIRAAIPLTPSSAGAQATRGYREGVADSGRKIAETAIRSDVQLGDHYAGYRGPCPHVSEHIECLHFMFKEFVTPTPADYSEYQKKHRLELKERDETIARLREGFTWAMAQLDDTQELRDEFGLVCVQCKPVNNEHATDCKLVKYRALLDQAQCSTQQRSGNAPTGSWASGEREGRG